MTARSWWIWLSFPLAGLAMLTSLLGIFVPATYAQETPNWAGQAVGEDVANVVAYTAMLLFALGTMRGSIQAYLGLVATLAYSVYAYAIYAFAVHFGPLFLAYVAVLGLSVFALIGALGSIDANRVKAMFRADAPTKSTASVAIFVGSLFALLWLSEIVPATVQGTTPQSLVDAGLASNPVYVLDLAVLLPASVISGILLWRRAAWGFLLAPMLLGVLALLSIGIVAAFAVLASRGETVPVPVAAFVAALAVVQLAVFVRFLRAA
jgi:hypothetical protein